MGQETRSGETGAEPAGEQPPEAADESPPPPPGDPNEVRLVGRLAAPAEMRTLPSGTMIATFRLIVRRPPTMPRPGAGRHPTVDVIDCVAWAQPLQEALRRCRTNERLEVRGALRRRFWRSSASDAQRRSSSFEVELTTVARVGLTGSSTSATGEPPS